WVKAMQPLDRRQSLLDRTGVILRKVSDRYFMTPPDRAAIDIAGRCLHVGCRRQQRLQERGLALSVATDQDHLLPSIDDRAESGHDRRLAVGLGDAGTLERHTP